MWKNFTDFRTTKKLGLFSKKIPGLGLGARSRLIGCTSETFSASREVFSDHFIKSRKRGSADFFRSAAIFCLVRLVGKVVGEPDIRAKFAGSNLGAGKIFKGLNLSLANHTNLA